MDKVDESASDQSEALPNTPEVSNTYVYLLVCMVIIIVFLLFAVYFINRNNYIASPQNIAISPTIPDKAFCINNTKEHSFEEAFNNPAEVCDLRIPKTASESAVPLLISASRAFTHLESIYFNGTIGVLPPEIGNIATLKSLNLHHTINTILPPEIGRLKNLTVLYLNKTDVENIPSEIGNLTELNQFVIVKNTKSIIIPAEIEKLSKLKTLTLRENKAIKLPDISHNQQLTYIDLSLNAMDELPESVYSLQALTVLNASDNKISIISSKIGQLVNLTELRLDNNGMRTFPSVGKLHNLETLNLSDNKLSNLPDGIEQLKKLKYLNVTGNAIPKRDIEQLKNLLPETQIVF